FVIALADSMRSFPTFYTSLISFVFTLDAIFFFFNYTSTTEIYTLSLHDALPISQRASAEASGAAWVGVLGFLGPSLGPETPPQRDRKSTRLNSSHGSISYAVFCLKKKKIKRNTPIEIPHNHNTRKSNTNIVASAH